MKKGHRVTRDGGPQGRSPVAPAGLSPEGPQWTARNLRPLCRRQKGPSPAAALVGSQAAVRGLAIPGGLSKMLGQPCQSPQGRRGLLGAWVSPRLTQGPRLQVP